MEHPFQGDCSVPLCSSFGSGPNQRDEPWASRRMLTVVTADGELEDKLNRWHHEFGERAPCDHEQTTGILRNWPVF